MKQESVLSLPAPCTEQRRNLLTSTLQVFGLTAAVTLGAYVRIPLGFTPVPITLQTFPVLLAPFLMGPYRASVAVALYAILGMCYAPVFTAPPGPTLGYILGFFAAVWVIPRFRYPAAGLLAGTAVIYLCGISWLILAFGMGPVQAVVLGVAPFVPGDLLKVIAAYKLLCLVRPEAVRAPAG